MIVVVSLLVVFLKRGRADDANQGAKKERPPNQEMIKAAQRLVKVRVTPSFPFSFDLMKPGVFQHIDRRYTYDVVPPELINGFLFQGIHRPGKGTKVEFDLLSPAKVYFFFHEGGDRSYSAIFAKLDGWKRCASFPQYDIHNGDHGLKMVSTSSRLARELIRFLPPLRTRPVSISFFSPRRIFPPRTLAKFLPHGRNAAESSSSM